MKSVYADERGRITLGSGILEKYGRKFAIVRTRNTIVLVPIPKEPLKDLQEMWKSSGIEKYKLKDLKKAAREEAEKEIDEELEENVRRQ